MNKIIFYTLNGEKQKELPLTLDNISKCNGMKVKCLLKNAEEKVGFADVYTTHNIDHYDGTVHDYINLWVFKYLDESTNKLAEIGEEKFNQIFEEVNISDIINIEAILFSNPRFNEKLTNKFYFIYDS